MKFKILRWFHYQHLPANMQEVSKACHDLAHMMANRYLRGSEEVMAELQAGLRHLLEAKDCFVRAERAAMGGEPEAKPPY